MSTEHRNQKMAPLNVHGLEALPKCMAAGCRVHMMDSPSHKSTDVQ